MQRLTPSSRLYGSSRSQCLQVEQRGKAVVVWFASAIVDDLEAVLVQFLHDPSRGHLMAFSGGRLVGACGSGCGAVAHFIISDIRRARSIAVSAKAGCWQLQSVVGLRPSAAVKKLA
jgi:hypothetical protein